MRWICILFHRKHWHQTPMHNHEGEFVDYWYFCRKCFREWTSDK